MNENEMKNQYNFEYIHARDVAFILGTSTFEVRKMCKENKIEATQRENSIHYDILTEQFRNHPNWDAFLQKHDEQRQKSLALANYMVEYWSQDFEEITDIEYWEFELEREDKILLYTLQQAGISPIDALQMIIELLERKEASEETVHIIKEKMNKLLNPKDQ